MREGYSHNPSWLGWFLLFWRVILWLSLGAAIYEAVQANSDLLHSWRGVVGALLVVAFVSAYELYERSDSRRGGQWPTPFRQVLAYLCFQLALVAILLHASTSFLGAGLALTGQVCSSLPMRKWPIPLGAILALISVPMGAAESVVNLDWDGILGFFFFASSWVVVAIFISMLFAERYRREHLIAELRQTKDELERYALQAEELAALRERTRLAREMHDSLGHALVVVNVKLEAAQRLYAVDSQRGDAELAATRELVRATMGELRRSLANLRAEPPDYRNLPSALERIAAETRARANLSLSYAGAPELPALAPEASEVLWRVAREALANIERHAEAANAALSLERANGAVVLRVTDDGAGISAADLARPGHYGITGMRERVEALGGTLRVAVRPGGGTIVEASLPVEG